MTGSQSPKRSATASQSESATDLSKTVLCWKQGPISHLFLAQYRGVLLVKDGVTRIVKSVVLSAERKIWQLLTAQAKHDEYDDSYVEDPHDRGIETIDVIPRKGRLASLIKEFNKRTTTDLV
jgi:hypothetical protein